MQRNDELYNQFHDDYKSHNQRKMLLSVVICFDKYVPFMQMLMMRHSLVMDLSKLWIAYTLVLWIVYT